MNETIEKKICAVIDDMQPEAVNLLSNLVGFDTQLGNEQAAQDYMADYFKSLGLNIDRFEIDEQRLKQLEGYSPSIVSYDNRHNVVGCYTPTCDSLDRGRSLILNGHIDVGPCGPLEKWQSDPYQARVEGDKLYGRGSGDMKAGIAAYCIAFKAIKAAGYQPKANLYLQSVVEEECTGNGALACLDRGYTADAAIIPEPFSQTIMKSQCGVMWFQLKISGHPAHVLDTSAGVNAIEAGYELFSYLKGLEAQWNLPENKHEDFAHYDHPINFNLGEIKGGDWSSTVPTECTLFIRVGFYPDKTLEQVKVDIEDCLAMGCQSMNKETQFNYQVIYQGFQAQGFSSQLNTPLMDTLAHAHHAITATEVNYLSSTATTDARFFHCYGNIPATCYGPIAGDYHSFNEWVSISSMMEVAKVLAVFICRWCLVEKIDDDKKDDVLTDG